MSATPSTPTRAAEYAARGAHVFATGTLYAIAAVVCLGAFPTWGDFVISVVYAAVFIAAARITSGIDLVRGRIPSARELFRRRTRVAPIAALRAALTGVAEIAAGVIVAATAHEAVTPVLVFGASSIGAMLAAAGLARIVRAGYAAQWPFRGTGHR